MIKFKGIVLEVKDETIQVPVKTKEGLPTGMNKDLRSVKIQLLCKLPDGKGQRAINVTSINPDSSFKVPDEGKEWETPSVRKYDATKGFPEVLV